MAELREFARHSNDLDELRVLLVPSSVDDQQDAHDACEKIADKKFTILSDPRIVRDILRHTSAKTF